MSLRLPNNPDLRYACDVQALADRKWVPLQAAREAARRTFANDPDVHRVLCQVLRADDRIQLIEFGPRGGWKVRHTFGRERDTR